MDLYNLFMTFLMPGSEAKNNEIPAIDKKSAFRGRRFRV